VHWTEHPIAIYPDELGTAFSGSAVVDERNTAGLQTGAKPPLVCIYTAAGQEFTQCLSYSNDDGQTWTKYAGNPVLRQLAPGNRDPKVFWHGPGARWIMALYLDKNDFAIFASPDLKHWQKLSDLQIPGTIECPELFELPLVDAPGKSRWIFYGANGGYLVGQFDGTRFTAESGPHELHHGNCFYASQTYTNIPAKDGRRILIPWGQVALPGMPFNQMMGLPVVLTLHETADGPRVFVKPVQELDTLRANTHTLAGGTLSPGDNPLANETADLAEIVVEFEPADAEQVVFNLRGLEIAYDAKTGSVRCLDKQAPLAAVDGKVSLRMFVDRASVDIFGGAGSLYMPMGHNLATNDRSFSMTTRGGAAQIRALVFHELKSAWQSAAR
jgi:sucrose-6-phosphate hydrolase SacC (GH32 family)